MLNFFFLAIYSLQLAAAAAAIEGRRPAIPRNWDSRWSDLLQQCWDENPGARPGFDVIIEKLEKYSHDVLKTNYDSVAIDQVDSDRCGKCIVS